jgi:hypothetical protein
MDDTLAPRLLDRDMVDRAYPLVRNIAPGITLDRWNRFARPLIASRSTAWPRGLMTIQNTTGYILGLFGFEVRDDLNDGRTLHLDNIITANIPGRDKLWSAVMDAAEHLAKVNGCRAIRAGLVGELDPSDKDRAWLIHSLEGAGFALDGVRACKRLEAVNGAAAGNVHHAPM